MSIWRFSDFEIEFRVRISGSHAAIQQPCHVQAAAVPDLERSSAEQPLLGTQVNTCDKIRFTRTPFSIPNCSEWFKHIVI